MSDQQKVEFIGHRAEIEKIRSSMWKWGTQQILFIHGSAGVGKTSLIGEVHRLVKDELSETLPTGRKPNFRILEIIDLDDIRLEFPEDIAFRIIPQLGFEGFESYLEELQKLQGLEKTFSDRIVKQRNFVRELFTELLIDASHRQRLAIFCDTTDVVKTEQSQQVLDYLLYLGGKLDNIVMIFSGRDTDKLFNSFMPDRELANVELLHISPLTLEESRAYLEQKRRLLHVTTIKPEIEERLLRFSKGIPFIIDLAAEWSTREIPFLWLTDESLEDLPLISEDLSEEMLWDFESHLVRHLEQLRNRLDLLTLVLAWVRPIEERMCAKLLAISGEDADELVSEAKNKPYIKTLPDGLIKLHDYMDELIERHVLNDIEDERKHRDSERAIEYFKERLNEINRQRNEFANNARDSRSTTLEALKEFFENQALEREYWQISVQMTQHAFYVDVNKAVSAFIEFFDEAEKANKSLVLSQLSTLALSNRTPMQWDNWCKVGIRYAGYLIYERDYSTAEDVLGEILNEPNTTPLHQVEALIKLGNVKNRIGNLELGLANFLKAIELASENQLSELLGLAELEAGWSYSLVGNWVEANNHFRVTLITSLERGNRELEATVLNELAYTKFYEDRNSALALCKDAINVCKESGFVRRLGFAYSNMGCLLYRIGSFEEAHNYFELAREILGQDDEWIGIISSWQGITYWAEAENSLETVTRIELLQRAEELISNAIVIGVSSDRARNLNRLARVYRSQKRNNEAWDELQKAYDASIELSDVFSEIASLRDLSSLALDMEIFEAFDELRGRLGTYEKRNIPRDGLRYGGALVYLGIMAIFLGDSEYGFSQVATGLKLLAETGNYANYTFAGALDTFQKYVAQYVAPNDKSELAAFLKQYWEQENLSQKYLEATRVFYKLQH